VARAFGVKHKTHRIGPGVDSGVHVLFAGQAADFDAGAVLRLGR
jgi:hypothetical protein